MEDSKKNNVERYIVSISAVPAGQYRSILEKDEIRGMGNATAVYALMSDDTIELYAFDVKKWQILPPIPKRL